MLTEISQAWRTLAARPGFSAICVLTLALGVGATAAIFSAVNGVVLRPLPYPDAESLTIVWLNNQREGIERDITSYPTFLDWQEAKSYRVMGGFVPTVGTLTGELEAEQFAGAWVTGRFFETLAVRPALGVAPGERHTRAGDDAVVVLSHGLWSRWFGADPGAIGRTVVVNGMAREVIGVMPRGFHYPTGAEYWTPIAPESEAWRQTTASRGSLWLSVIGRLHDGGTTGTASVELNTMMARLADEGLEDGANGVFVEPLRDTVIGAVKPGLLVLLGAVGFVLLIACANIANLMLARGAARRREFAVRAALGANGARLARQALTESVLLGLMGGAAGIALAVGGVAALVAFSPADLPLLERVQVDPVVVTAALGAALLTGLLFGVAPALQARGSAAALALRDADRGSSSGSLARLGPLLVGAEIALALVLLVGAGLLLRSYAALQTIDIGFATERVLSFRVSTGQSSYPEPDQVRAFQRELLERVEAIPGVVSASAINTLFLSRLPEMSAVAIEGQGPPTQTDLVVSVTDDSVAPGFFQAMGIPILRGRDLIQEDDAAAPQAVVVNETFVRRFLPGEVPIGRRFTRGDPADPRAVWQTIVGVVADSRRSGLVEPVRPEAYRPLAQAMSRSVEVLVRTAVAPLSIVPQVRSTLREIDPNVAAARIQTVEAALADALAMRKFVMALLVSFAALAVILAAVGTYGVLSYMAGQRMREFGIRFALGASRSAVLLLVFGQTLRYVLAGVVAGVLGAAALGGLLRSQLYGVTGTDPVTFLAMTVLIVTIALVAGLLPAHRASRIDPMSALREE